MASSFTSEYLTKSEYLTRFLLQNSAKFAIGDRMVAVTLAPVISFEALAHELA